MKLTSFYTNSPLRNYNHYFVSDSGLDAYIFDPLKLDFIFESLPDSIINYYLLNTHEHYDHISKNSEFMSLDNSKKIELKDKEVYMVSETESITAFFTPGHHPNHYCYLLEDKNNNKSYLVSGDNIFNCGIGNCKSAGANIDDLYNSIELLLKNNDDDTTILTSHDYFLTNLDFALSIDNENTLLENYKDQIQRDGVFFTSFGQEKQINPFFRLEQIKHLSGFEGMTSKEVFIKLRELRDNW